MSRISVFAVVLFSLGSAARAAPPSRLYPRTYDARYRRDATLSYAERYGLYRDGSYAQLYGLYGWRRYDQWYGLYRYGRYSERYRLYTNELFRERYGLEPVLNGPDARRLPFLGQNGTAPNMGGYPMGPYPWGIGYYGFYGYYYGPW